MAESTPMMQQYERIKAQHGDTILFFRLGDFYEMFRQDALDASRLLSLTLTQRNGVPMCGIPHHAARTYIPRLLASGRKIAICDQLGDAQAGKGIVERQVTQIITPGTLIDEEYLEQGSQNFLLSVAALPGQDQAGRLSLALFDMSTGELFIETAEPGNAASQVETLIAKWQPREALVQDSLLRQDGAIDKLFYDHPGLLINRFADWQYDLVATESQLCRLIGVLSLKSYGLQPLDPRLQAVSAVLSYAEHTAKHRLDHIRELRINEPQRNLALDETAVRNLELVRNLQDGSRNFSLLEVLDQTRTPMGARLLRLWILQPLREASAIEARLEALDWLYHRQAQLNQLREELRSIVDVPRLANRVALDKAHPKDLVALGLGLARMASVLDSLGQLVAAETVQSGLLAGLVKTDELAAAARQAERLRSALADEPSLSPAEGPVIRDGHDVEVDDYRRLRGNSESILEAYVEEERQASGMASLKVRQNNIIGFYLEVTKSNLGSVPAHFMRKQSMVNAERFTTTRLMELEESIAQAGERCAERERLLFLELRDSLKPFLKDFHGLAESIAVLDVLCSLAWVATARGYTRPRIHADKRLVIRGGRHPVVEEHVGQGRFIPNDLSLAAPETAATTALITGPNMAGKSTFLRQTALIALMAHIGSFVPADAAEIGLVDRIFCRIGASDNLARGESTFLVEMNETAFILRSASPASLVIMDEVGRGTSTQDGLSIARAILEYLLVQSTCRCLFATHFHELTEVQDGRLHNLSMAVDDSAGTITFLKKVVEGPSSNSYGIHVARLAGIPDAVIGRAEEILATLRPEQAAAALGPGIGLRPEAPGKSGRRAPAGPSLQGGLFSASDEIEQLLRNFNVDQSTPLAALNAIAAWKKLLGS